MLTIAVLDVANNEFVYCTCAAACNYRPRASAIGALEQDKKFIRESVDSLCRDGADAQYMQYLSKSRITSPKIR